MLVVTQQCVMNDLPFHDTGARTKALEGSPRSKVGEVMTYPFQCLKITFFSSNNFAIDKIKNCNN